MAYFPFMVDIGNQRCLVVGGGRIALHKVKILLGFGVHIKVVADTICQELSELYKGTSAKAGEISEDTLIEEKTGDTVAEKCRQHGRGFGFELVQREFQDRDIVDMDFVVAATDDEELNYHISDLCRQNKIPINAVDMKEACSFIFPAMIQEKDLLIAISSGGQSPAAAAYVKQQVKRQIPAYYGDMIENLGRYRDYILEHVDTADNRKKVFNKLLEYGDSHDGEIPEERVYEVISEVMSDR